MVSKRIPCVAVSLRTHSVSVASGLAAVYLYLLLLVHQVHHYQVLCNHEEQGTSYH
jgi:hypothetical protein